MQSVQSRGRRSDAGFSTDRPTKSDSPCSTVDCGHFQYEADVVNWIYDHNNTSQNTVSNVIVGDPVQKLWDFTNRTDLQELP